MSKLTVRATAAIVAVPVIVACAIYLLLVVGCYRGVKYYYG